MREAALAALYRAMQMRLSGEGVWGQRAYADMARAKIVRPYVVYAWSGGGDANLLPTTADAEIVLIVKCVSNNQSEALVGVAQLAALLDDRGSNDRVDVTDPARLVGSPEWEILTTTKEGIVRLVELIDGVNVYHEGFYLRVTMEGVG